MKTLILIVLAVLSANAQESVKQEAHYKSETIAGFTAQLPDPNYSPGAENPDITQATIRDTTCNPHWSTKSIRPPASYTDKLKREQMIAYGDTVPQVPPLGKPPDVSKCVAHSNDPRCYEEDHIEPIEGGGNPTDKKNLMPQPYFPIPGAHEKDKVENLLFGKPRGLVCSGKMPLIDAQKAIKTDWLAVWVRHIGE